MASVKLQSTEAVRARKPGPAVLTMISQRSGNPQWQHGNETFALDGAVVVTGLAVDWGAEVVVATMVSVGYRRRDPYGGGREHGYIGERSL